MILEIKADVSLATSINSFDLPDLMWDIENLLRVVIPANLARFQL